ncbi:MFS transporter [Streptomyces sp. NPDC050355]|uniref:MFS transporter n=1 Tax=Streptomyces sp. NPDC050355 TaxID=3365609 RepID=UPI0037B50ADD
MTGLGKPYWFLWASSTIANLGDGMRLVALPLLAYSVSNNPLDITFIMVFASLPGLLIGPLAGVVVDRFDRRRVIAVGNVMRTVPVLVFACLVQLGELRLSYIYALAVLLPVFEVFVDSATRPLMSELLPENLLEKGNSRMFIARMVSQDMLGSPVSGFLVGVSASMPFFVNGTTYIGATIMVLMLRSPVAVRSGETPREPATGRAEKVRTGVGAGISSIGRDLAEGFATIRRLPLLRAMALTSAALNFVLLTGSSLLVVYAKEDLGLTDEQFAFLFTTAAVGSALGGSAAPRIVARFGTGRTLVWGLVAIGASRAGFGLAHEFWSALVSFFAIGAATFVYNVAVASYLQRVTPNALIGRVYATTQAVSYGAAVAAALTAGGLAQITGIRNIMLIGGLAAAGCGLLCRRAAFRAGEAGGERDGVASAQSEFDADRPSKK